MGKQRRDQGTTSSSTVRGVGLLDGGATDRTAEQITRLASDERRHHAGAAHRASAGSLPRVSPSLLLWSRTPDQAEGLGGSALPGRD